MQTLQDQYKPISTSKLGKKLWYCFLNKCDATDADWSMFKIKITHSFKTNSLFCCQDMFGDFTQSCTTWVRHRCGVSLNTVEQSILAVQHAVILASSSSPLKLGTFTYEDTFLEFFNCCILVCDTTCLSITIWYFTVIWTYQVKVASTVYRNHERNCNNCLNWTEAYTGTLISNKYVI
jgi:hypothetical protein